MRRLFRVDVRVVGFAYVETEEEARTFAAELVQEWDQDDVRVRLVKEKGDHPPVTWDGECIPFGPEDVCLADVWPGGL